jgi:hypothetical protein
MRQVGEVECAQRAVEQPQRDQEERRSDEVEHDIADPGARSGQAAAVGEQRVRGEQHDFEEDEEVEQVAGQECAG